ncbi:Fc.00g082650.m01.CDS01 [Cosmosporella sp. VM-42]
MPRYDPSLQTEEIESAYRTILVSYLVRSVYSALVYQTCTLLAELGSLPVFIPQQQQFLEDPIVGPEQELWSELRQNAAMQGLLDPGSQTISYNNFVDLWTQQRRGLGSEANDRFTILLLVAYSNTKSMAFFPTSRSEAESWLNNFVQSQDGLDATQTSKIYCPDAILRFANFPILKSARNIEEAVSARFVKLDKIRHVPRYFGV